MPGLYVHVPFCARKCVYCDFYSVALDAPAAPGASGDAGDREQRIERFIAFCLTEIALRQRLTADCPPFSSVYVGGGTPSLLSPAQVRRILHSLLAAFPVAADAEISMECNPGTVDASSLAAYREAGVNRISLGVQSFRDDDLRLLGRIHTSRDVLDAVDAARRAGFVNISIDLMFSLPDQTAEGWLRNLGQARELGIPHLSCYSLTVEEGTPLHRSVAAGRFRPPDEDSDAALFELTMETLAGWGYDHYEVSNYALPGFACRHNRSYWRGEDYLGFGPAAFSTWRDRREWNVRDTAAYEQSLAAGTLPVDGGEDLDIGMRRSERIYLGLRGEGIDLDAFRALHGDGLLTPSGGIIEEYFAGGFLRLRGNVLQLTPSGFLLCDEICARLMGMGIREQVNP
jgi:oxygen-independent coproporphyrinogen III oxidase